MWEPPSCPAPRARGTAVNSLELPRTDEPLEDANPNPSDFDEPGPSAPDMAWRDERVRAAAQFILEPERRRGPLSQNQPYEQQRLFLAHPTAINSPRHFSLASPSGRSSRCPSHPESRAASPHKTKVPEGRTVTFVVPGSLEQRLQEEPAVAGQGGADGRQALDEARSDRQGGQTTGSRVPKEVAISENGPAPGQAPAED